LQIASQVGAPEVVGESDALGSQRLELRAPFGNDLVLVGRKDVF
jgi:hypothetical protein